MSVIETLVSVPFAVAITALLRKRWPQIDGAYVYAVVLLLSIIGAVLTYYHAAIPEQVWIAAGPLLAAILAIGGVQTAQHVTHGGVPAPEFGAEFGAEAPTKKEGK